MTVRTFLTMLLFVGIIGAIMWFLILPAVGGVRPTIPV
jgi:hypothetical protein